MSLEGKARRGSAKVYAMLRTLVAASALCALLLACEGPNVAACQAYQEHYQALLCAQGVDNGIECEAFADHPCDLTPYFECLKARQNCQNDRLVSDVEGCAEHLACNPG